MKRLNKVLLILIVAILSFSTNLSEIFANESESLQSTHYWRICSASWSKSDFGLPSNAPNVSVNASWAYNISTNTERKVWTVNNATKESLMTSGELALPRIKVGAWGSVAPSSYKQGTCSYSNLPVGLEPFSIKLELE